MVTYIYGLIAKHIRAQVKIIIQVLGVAHRETSYPHPNVCQDPVSVGSIRPKHFPVMILSGDETSTSNGIN